MLTQKGKNSIRCCAEMFSYLQIKEKVVWYKKYGRRDTSMISCNCPKCNAKLRVEENDTAPGCREMEEVFCPVCHEVVTKVFTSGMPVAFVVRE